MLNSVFDALKIQPSILFKILLHREYIYSR